jgi:hypothetical protein
MAYARWRVRLKGASVETRQVGGARRGREREWALVGMDRNLNKHCDDAEAGNQVSTFF